VFPHNYSYFQENFAPQVLVAAFFICRGLMPLSPLLNVLVVDDENSFRLMLEMALKMTNEFMVQSCDSGERAKEILQQETFDVILLDNRMADMTGLEVMEWMHTQKMTTPVIMVTAAGSESIAVEAMQLGVFDYIRKDQLDIDRLKIAVKSVHERYLYRKAIIERDAEKRLLSEKQEELRSLQTFHDTVNSVGQLVEQNLAGLMASLERYEHEMLKTVTKEGAAQNKKLFEELKQSIEVIASGVSSMRNLSSIVTRKLDEINLTRSPGKTPE
jgi:DNA-binding response OmpR family regulator